MVKKFFPIFVLAFLLAGCSIFVKAPIQEMGEKNVVFILFNDTSFKTEVVENVSQSLTAKGYRVVTDNVKQARYYNSADYGAVVYMAELWAWHTPWHARKFHRNNNTARNTVFVITSGDPDVVIKEPFEAVTSASKTGEVERVSREILEKLDNILIKRGL